jgi:hypothetical protein
MNTLKNIEHTISCINKSIENANNGISKITTEIKDIPGMSSIKIRHFLNNIATNIVFNYLEVGLWKGSTISSVLFNNTLNVVYGIDNFSELTDLWYNGKSIKDELLNNIKRFNNMKNNIIFYEEDFFKIDLNGFSDKINLFVYDGNHEYDMHEKALYKAFDILDEYFIYIIDDIQFSCVRDGLNMSLKTLQQQNKIEILYQIELDALGTPSNNNNEWWNGYSINYIRKI